jgi:cholinesterase
VWIYGGGFESGSSNNPFYNGRVFADDQDVVLVSLNYRTNVLGFPGLPGTDSAAQNPGLMDQRLAIEWVRDNIEAFGGDKDRITIFGFVFPLITRVCNTDLNRQSAGGASVDLYAYAYQDDPIVHAMISQSGTATAFFSPPPKNNSVAWFNASVALGCGDESVGAEASLECVRKAPLDRILNVTTVSDPLKSVLGNFGPTSDGEVVFSDYDNRARRGDFIQKPYLVGNNDYEAGLFWLFAIAAGRTFSDLEWCLFNADIFTCPVAKAAAFRHQNGVKTYRYRYYGDFYNLRLTTSPASGAWHGAEIPIIFQAAEQASGVPNTPEEEAISNYMQKAWADFAKKPYSAFDGAPYNYPEYDPAGKVSLPYTQKCRYIC